MRSTHNEMLVLVELRELSNTRPHLENDNTQDKAKKTETEKEKSSEDTEED